MDVKNVLYLSYDGMTDPLGQSQVLPYLKGLSKLGYQFHIISFEKEERFEAHRPLIQQICDENGIVWHPLKYTKKPPLLSTMWDLRQMKKLAFALHKNIHFDIIHCRSYLSAMVGLAFKRKNQAKFIFDMRGFWADERIEGGIWSLKNPVLKIVYHFFKRKEIEFFREADYIVSLTNNGKQEIESWEDLKSQYLKIEVIPCCVDLNLFDPSQISAEEKNNLRDQLKLSGHFVLGYVGSIGTWYMLSEMLDYFKILKLNRPNAKFLFVSGENPATILDLATSKFISAEDIVIASCVHNQVPLYISLFDLSIFFIRPTFSKKASSPTKQGEIMAMGIPLVCNAGVGDTDFVVQKYHSGKVIDVLNDANYQKSIDSTVAIDYDQMKVGAKEFFGLEKGIQSYYKIYKAVDA